MNKTVCIYIILFNFLFQFISNAQDVKIMTLENCIAIATQQSLDAFLSKNTYIKQYWSYHNYKASRYPSLSLNSTPIRYYNGISQVWDSDSKNYINYQTKYLDIEGTVRLQQNIGLTGGTLYLETVNEFLNNYTSRNTYTCTPFYITYNQNLNGYNDFKWRKIISVKSFIAAKQVYLEEKEDIAINTISYFFDVLLAEAKLDACKHKLDNSESNYRIGKDRLVIGAITNAEFRNLELDYYKSEIDLDIAIQDLSTAKVNLNIFLDFNPSTNLKCIIPEDCNIPSINVNDALSKAIENSPLVTNQQIKELEAKQSLAATKANNRFSSIVSVSYGLNGNNSNITDAYNDFVERQSVSLSLDIPLIDWGVGKSEIEIAKSTLEAEQIKNKQEWNEFIQCVTTNVIKFNLQKKLVDNLRKADSVSMEIHDASFEMHKIRKIDNNHLFQSTNDKGNARETYLNSLKDYWIYWYTIRKLTLYDFEKNIMLSEDFDKVTNIK